MRPIQCPPMLAVELAQIGAGERLSGHSHATPHLMIVTAGDLMQRAAERDQDLAAGSFRLSRGNAEHDLHFGSHGADCLIFEASGPFWARVFSRALNKAGANAFGTAPGVATLISLPDDRIHASPAQLIALGRVLAIAVAGHATERAPVWIDEALHMIEHGGDRAIADVADTLRRDRIHFTRAFGDWLGFRPAEYRALRRAATALNLLRETDTPLAEAALECGYTHQSHMNRAFRALFGQSPAQCRASFVQDNAASA
jgi:AraC-like DNA-binding protein